MKAVVGIALASMAGSAMAADVAPEASTNRTLKVSDKALLRGDFDYAGDADAYRVYLKKGINYGFRVATVCKNKSVAIYDKGFRLLARSSATDAFHDAWVERPAPYSGTYFVQVRSEPTPPDANCSEPEPVPVNAYWLDGVQNCGATRKTTCAVAIGTTGIRTIWAPADKAWSYFDVTTPGTYRIAGLAAYPPDQPYWAAGGTLALRDPTTRVITERGAGDFDQCGEGEACIQQELTKAGRYFVVLRMPRMSTDSGSQRYRIKVVKID